MKRKKIKIAWICHFSNEHIRQRLPLSSYTFENLIRRLLKKDRLKNYSDFAPWVSSLVDEFEKFEDVELHVIAPHRGLKKTKVEFNEKGVYYHFFKSDRSFINFNQAAKAKQSNYKESRKIVSQLVASINPDLVNLIGAENPYYSITALDIKDRPLYVTCQTVYSNPLRKVHSNSVDQYRWNLEKKIHSSTVYFGCTGRMHHDLVVKNNPEAIVLKMFFPIEKPQIIKQEEKGIDFVFYAAGVTEKKGIEDALNALSKVKKYYQDVSLEVVGRCDGAYKEHLIRLIHSLGLKDNVSFKAYFPLLPDMHQYITKGRFALLPVKLDAIPGTVVEAIYLNLPVVTYQTTGTPFLNKNGEAVLLSPIGDIEALADNMLRLMNDASLGVKLNEKARALVEEEFDNTKSAERLFANYRAVIAHYYKNEPIAQELLFDIKEFPLYQ